MTNKTLFLKVSPKTTAATVNENISSYYDAGMSQSLQTENAEVMVSWTETMNEGVYFMRFGDTVPELRDAHHASL